MSDDNSRRTVAVRQGIASGVLRYMLVGGLALVLIGLVIAFVVA